MKNNIILLLLLLNLIIILIINGEQQILMENMDIKGNTILRSSASLSPTVPTLPDNKVSSSSPTVPTRLPTVTKVQGGSTSGSPTVEVVSSTLSPTIYGNSSTNITFTNWEEIPTWAQWILCIAGIIFGLIQVYYGYRFFPFSVFMIGGFIAFIIMLGILGSSIPESNENKVAITYGVSAATWVVVGILLIVFTPIAIFVLGASIGVFIAIILNPICLHYVWPENPVANLYIWMAVFGLITGLITCYFERPILIVATAVGGSTLVILAIGGLAGNLPILSQVEAGNILWEWWAYFGGFLALLVTGLLIQLCYTSVGREHRGENAPGGYGRLSG